MRPLHIESPTVPIAARRQKQSLLLLVSAESEAVAHTHAPKAGIYTCSYKSQRRIGTPKGRPTKLHMQNVRPFQGCEHSNEKYYADSPSDSFAEARCDMMLLFSHDGEVGRVHAG
jgi:hypothetical protein